MNYKEWDVIEFNNNKYIVDYQLDDMIHCKRDPNNLYKKCHITAVKKITKDLYNYLDEIYENLHAEYHDLFLEKINNPQC